MSVLKWFVPRKVRHVAHPLGYAKRRLTPKPVRVVQQARHPVGTATSAATIRVIRGGRRGARSKRPATRWQRRAR